MDLIAYLKAREVEEKAQETQQQVEQAKEGYSTLKERLDTEKGELEGTLDSKVTLEQVNNKIQEIVGSAPEALDTLQEIAEALDNDPDFANTMINMLSSKVNKVEGKGLSTEDFTTALKDKLNLLKNYDGEVSDFEAFMEYVDGKIPSWDGKTRIIQSDEKPEGIEPGRIWLDTSDNAYQGTVFEDLQRQINEGTVEDVEEKLNAVHRHNTAQDRELAYLKLKQEASDRIENGTTFADDFLGNRFGIEFSEEESENIRVSDGAVLMVQKEIGEIRVEDATVVDEAYGTQGNGGRKLVRLENGWLVAVVVDKLTFRFYKSEDGKEFTPVTELINDGTMSIAMVARGNLVHAVLTYYTNTSDQRIIYYRLDPMANSGGVVSFIDRNQTGLGYVSLTINPEGTELHATWSSKNSSYPNSFNIRYIKGTFSEINDSVSWGDVEQVTQLNVSGANMDSPSIAIRHDGSPFIAHEYTSGSSPNRIQSRYYNGSTWGLTNIYTGDGYYTQSSPSAIFIPPEVNGLLQGRIWVVWQGEDSGETRNQTRVSFSDDGGVTWSDMEKLTNGIMEYGISPTITANPSGEVFVLARSQFSGSIIQRTYSNGTWGELETVTGEFNATHPSALFDLSVEIVQPLFIHGGGTKVRFHGTWVGESEVPAFNSSVVYNLPSTDYVGVFVKKEHNVDIEAYANDELMESELEDDEYMFTKALMGKESVDLRLELSRDTLMGDGSGDRVIRILGGRS